LNAAYQVASAGDVVAIKGGTYGGQSLANRTNLAVGSSPVTFCVSSGDSVVFNSGNVADPGLDISTHDVTVSGAYCGSQGSQQVDHISVPVSTAGVDVGMSLGAGDRNVVIDNVHTDALFTDAWATTLEYSEVGPLPNAVCQGGGPNDLVDLWWIGADETNPGEHYKVLFNYIHDGQCGPPAHVDGIQMEAGNTLIEGNRISNCSQLIYNGVSASNAGNSGYAGVVVRNNMLEEQNSGTNGWTANDCDTFQEVSTGPPMDFEYNTLDGQVSLGSTGTNIARGNIFLNQTTCPLVTGSASLTCDRNVFPAGHTPAGSNGKACTPLLATGSPWTDTNMGADYHLSTSDTCATGVGATTFPTLDLDGQTRTSPAWAGADQP
jgi:hypothetical protein